MTVNTNDAGAFLQLGGDAACNRREAHDLLRASDVRHLRRRLHAGRARFDATECVRRREQPARRAGQPRKHHGARAMILLTPKNHNVRWCPKCPGGTQLDLTYEKCVSCGGETFVRNVIDMRDMDQLFDECRARFRSILDLADARLRNPQELTPNCKHDLEQIAAAAREVLDLAETSLHRVARDLVHGRRSEVQVHEMKSIHRCAAERALLAHHAASSRSSHTAQAPRQPPPRKIKRSARAPRTHRAARSLATFRSQQTAPCTSRPTSVTRT